MTWVGCEVGGSGPPFGAPRRALAYLPSPTWITRFRAKVKILRKGKRWFSKLDVVYPPLHYRKLTLAKAFPGGTVPNAYKLEQRGGSPYASRKPPRCHESISYVGEYGSPRVRGSAWELKFDAERGPLGGFGGLVGGILRVWKALGGSKCRTARVWKFKTSINI